MKKKCTLFARIVYKRFLQVLEVVEFLYKNNFLRTSIKAQKRSRNENKFSGMGSLSISFDLLPLVKGCEVKRGNTNKVSGQYLWGTCRNGTTDKFFRQMFPKTRPMYPVSFDRPPIWGQTDQRSSSEQTECQIIE